MQNFISDFIATYGMEIIGTIFLGLVGFIGAALKQLYQKHVDDDTKRAVVKTCVQAVEQLYSDLHGADKFSKAIEAAAQMLTDKGIKVTELELEMLIEAAVGEFNNVFGGSDETAVTDGTDSNT